MGDGNNLKPAKQICLELADFLGWASVELIELGGVSDWLFLAGGIVNVKHDLPAYEDSFPYCGMAYDWNEARNKILPKFIQELVIFNFIWSGLECFIDSVELSRDEASPGKIAGARKYLNENFDRKDVFPLYKESLDALIHTLKESPYFHSSFDNMDTKDVLSQGEALGIIYKIRNKFAHGSLAMPVPQEDDNDGDYIVPEEHEYPKLINLCSILLLMSIQMLVYIYVREVRLEKAEDMSEYKEMDIYSFLRQVHLKNSSLKQLNFKDFFRNIE